MPDNKELILIIDDQPANLKVISSVLGKRYSLSVADSGNKALEILNMVQPDLILLDIMMPEMDGYEVCSIIKNDSRLKDIPIIFLTAKNEIDDIVRGFELGAVDYITKPFNIAEVKVRVENHLNLAYARNKIIGQKKEIEDNNLQLIETQDELEKRNEDLMVAQEAIEKHAHEINVINQKLMESEYRLKQSNAELIKTNLEKDKFFSIIAHDLKSPFSGLLGLLKMLNDEGDSLDKETRQEMISSLFESSKRVYSLLENLLEWSRLERKSFQFKPSRIRANDLIKSIMVMIKTQADSKNISLINDVPDNAYFFGDDRMVSTIIRNLLSNAIKFTYDGGKVMIYLPEETDEYITIAVEDNGMGMSSRIREGLFNIGSKISQQGTHNEAGTGLGLVLSKEFAEINNGEISVESEENEGSTFYLTLPKNSSMLASDE